MINVFDIEVWVGAITSIIGLTIFVIRPILKMINNLNKMGHSLDLVGISSKNYCKKD